MQSGTHSSKPKRRNDCLVCGERKPRSSIHGAFDCRPIFRLYHVALATQSKNWPHWSPVMRTLMNFSYFFSCMKVLGLFYLTKRKLFTWCVRERSRHALVQCVIMFTWYVSVSVLFEWSCVVESYALFAIVGVVCSSYATTCELLM